MSGDDNSMRIAIVGSGPAGFYTADQLLKKGGETCTVDMFDRLPMPYGLVRFGVAPDHQKIKNVIRQFEGIAQDPRFRFWGNVDFGKDMKLADFKRHYHAVCFSTGAQTDRRLGIPGEDLRGSHPATDFVAWYNGHPDFRDLEFELDAERVAVIGIGNVAVDVARILCRTVEELEKTDIADYALEALAESKVKEVFMLGRRGPAQAAFTTPEIKELGELEGADIRTMAAEVELDELSAKAVKEANDRKLERKLEIIREYSTRERTDKPRLLTVRFLVSPTELKGSEGRVQTMTLVHNRLEEGKTRLRAVPTDETEELDVQLVFRSVGYRGVPLADVPFDDDWGTIPNRQGRVTEVGSDEPAVGIYVSGWIKRGPTGVIGTNKPDGAETAEAILEDFAAGRHLTPELPDRDEAATAIRAKQSDVITFDDWKRLDSVEVQRGSVSGRPRVKLTTRDEVRAALKS